MKKRIFAAAAALLTGVMSSLPVTAATTFSAMKKAVYHAHFGKGQAFYEELSDRWYHVTGEPLNSDKTTFRSNDAGYTCDTEQMVIYNPDGSENAALSIICKDLMTSEIFTFTQYNGEAIYANTPENALAQRMRASMPVSRQLILEQNTFRCLCVANSMPIIAIDAVLDGAFNVTEVNYDRFGDIYIENYTNSGDVNLDGKLTVSDAVILARIAAEDASVTVSDLGLTLSDLTADGLTDTGDVTTALRMIAGLYTEDSPSTASTGTTDGAVTGTATETTTAETAATAVVTTGFPKSMEDYLTVEFSMTAQPTRTEFAVGEEIDLSGMRFDARFYDPFRNIDMQIHNEQVIDFPEYIRLSGDALTADQPGVYDLIVIFDAGEALGSEYRVERSVVIPITFSPSNESQHAATTCYEKTTANCAVTTTTTVSAPLYTSTTFSSTRLTSTLGTSGTFATSTITEAITSTTGQVTIPPIATLPILTD